jgi:hypothetical protein
MINPVPTALPDPKGLGQTAEEKAAAEAYIAHLATMPEQIAAYEAEHKKAVEASDTYLSK